MFDGWRPVPGHPCEASFRGHICTVVRGLPYILARSYDPKGYPQVTVGGVTVRVHRLVALAWLPPPPRGKTQVRHLDGDKENCAAWNLKWGDDRDQHKDKVHAGTSRAKRVTSTNGSERESRVERGTGLNGSEKREKEKNKTEGSGAHDSRTTRT